MSGSLKNTKQFMLVYKNGLSYANRYLVMYVLANGLTYNRLGISVSKKVGNSVVRHRITRLIRESCRLSRKRLKEGYDIVVVARTGAKDRNYHDIDGAFLHLAGKHHLVMNETIL